MTIDKMLHNEHISKQARKSSNFRLFQSTPLTLSPGNVFSVNWEQVRKKFFVALNSVLSNCSGASDLMKLYLYESYCLPLLNYVIESLDPSKKTLRKLNVYWYTAFRKIFLDEPWEPVNGLIGALGRINLEFTYYQRKACFLNNMLNCDNCFVYHIMALYLHSNEYELLCKSEGISPYASKYSIRRHYDAYVL